MTVIAWDGKMLAADKQATNGGTILTTTKIRKVGNLLVGAAGDVSATMEALAWVERGRSLADYPEIQRDKENYAQLVVIHNGCILKYELSPYPVEIEDAFFAIGSGREFAMAAMYCGKTAKEAVEIACLFESGCGKGIDVLIPDLCPYEH